MPPPVVAYKQQCPWFLWRGVACLQWGLIVNTARVLVRQAMTYLPEERCGHLREAVARWTIAFARLSKLHLREEGDVAKELSGEGLLLACHALLTLLFSGGLG